MRCCTHILNLIVKNMLDAIGDEIEKVRKMSIIRNHHKNGKVSVNLYKLCFLHTFSQVFPILTEI